MLEYRPGYSNTCLPLDIDKPHAAASNKWSYIVGQVYCLAVLTCLSLLSQDLDSLAAIVTDQPHASTSASRASIDLSQVSRANGLKRSPSPDDGFIKAPENAKKARTERSTAFKRVLTHTFNLQPCRATSRKKGSKDHAMYPDALQANLTAFPTIKHDEHDLACLSVANFTQTHGFVYPLDPEDILTCICLLHDVTDLIRLQGGRMNKVLGKAKEIEGHLSKKELALDFHYTLEIEVHLDLANLRNVNTEGMKKSVARQVPSAIEGILRRAFLMDRNQDAIRRPVEEQSNTKYKKTDLAWFYACLPRPPVAGSYQQQDIKGKGKARDADLEIDEITGSRPIEAPGLVPRL